MKIKMEKINELVEERYGIPMCDLLDDSCESKYDSQLYKEAYAYRLSLMQDSAEDIEKKHNHDSLIKVAAALIKRSQDEKSNKSCHSLTNSREQLFSEYALRPHWTAKEAVALSFGLNPDCVFTKEKETVSPLVPNSLHINKLKDRLERALDSCEIKSKVGVYDKKTPLIRPEDYIGWTKRFGIVLPQEIVEKVITESDKEEYINKTKTYEEILDENKMLVAQNRGLVRTLNKIQKSLKQCVNHTTEKLKKASKVTKQNSDFQKEAEKRVWQYLCEGGEEIITLATFRSYLDKKERQPYILPPTHEDEV